MEEAPRELTPPPIQAPTAKEKKYDRQLRLWAASGQRALEESHVLLVIGGETGSNSSVAGAEALKNLILPSIGNFTVADSATVSEADLGVNFFLEANSLGKLRAEESKRLLEELNPDVTGNAISQKLENWLPQPESLKPFNLFILCAPVASEWLERICTYAEEQSVPVIYVHSVGLYSNFSVQLPKEFPIVDTHPDPDTIQDLRLLTPWPELVAEAESQTADLDFLSDHDHGHIPYIILLLYYVHRWKSTHNNTYPSTFKEKTEFRTIIRSAARSSSSAGPEENYDEAASAVLKTITPPTLNPGPREMFTLPSCQTSSLTPTTPKFWLIANAIKIFYETHSVLPLPGSLPDMKSTSTIYIKLQNIYKSKARADVAELTATVRATEKRLNRPEKSQVPQSEIEAFAKNANHIKILHGTPLPQLPTRLEAIIQAKSHLLEDDALDDLGEPSLYPIFHYFSTSNHPPTKQATPLAPSTLSQALSTSLSSGAELHNISSLTGGAVAQEAIKLLTRQYVPVDNTVVYDGVGGRMGVMNL